MKSAAESNEQDTRANGAAVDLNPEAIRAELEKILASHLFATSERLSRFLKHTVEGTLEGQNDRLKESVLGIEVFGRKPTYDPRTDAVVRTEAVKLRARLRDYYESEGREDPVRIDLPKGGYVPAFHLREEPPPEPPAALIPTALDAAVDAPGWKTMAAGIITVVVLALSIPYAINKGRLPSGEAGTRVVDSIAVLPFTDLSPQQDQEYFCDGMTDEIIDALTKVGGLRVVARTSSFAFKDKQQDIREIGKKLNVAAVLEGSVRKFGDKLRVTAQLNSVADGYHLWSETYERELKDVFVVQDEISRAIVDRLQAKVADRGNSVRSAPESLETYDLYLKGRYHWGRWRTEGAEKAIRYFEQAIAKDPRYAPAYAGLADSYCWLGFFSVTQPNVAMSKAKHAALKAIQLDDSLAAAHASLGYVNALYDFDWPGAERQFQRAIQLNPGLSDGHFGYGIVYLVPMGHVREAVQELERARDLDPLAIPTITYLGLAYQFNGRLNEAIETYKKALDLDPTFEEAHLELAQAYLSQRDFPAYYAELAKLPDGAASCRTIVSRAGGYALQGKKSEALAELRKLEALGPNTYVRPTSIAGVYAALGDREQAFHWLDRAVAERDGMLAYINYQGSLQPYHSDPRFRSLVNKLGLPAK